MKTVTGKYEPLSVINETMKREIKSLMAVLSGTVNNVLVGVVICQ